MTACSEGPAGVDQFGFSCGRIGARNTAMIEAVAELPPIVISDLFGISARTAYAWAQYAQDSWADYLAVCQGAE